MAGNTIYPVEPVGENYGQMRFFESAFKEDMLETFFSIFFSYMENVDVLYQDYEVEYSATEIQTSPMLVIEKVDADKALYLHVDHALTGTDLSIAERFDLTWKVSLGVNHKIILKRIIRQPLDPFIASLHKTILRYAPDKQAKKNIYQENNFFIVPADTAGPFLLHALPSLLKDFVLVGAENLREYKVKVVSPKLNVAFSSGIDFLEGEASLNFEDETISLQQVLSAGCQ
ncbi:MAG: hypothetical protein EGQ00_12865 [Parabacteroides johnsonii]|nr:hypothetical protein [Parabacteroides johnsonii]